MSSRSRSILYFALAFALFLLAPAYLSAPFPFYDLLTLGDVLDLITPLVLAPLYARLLYDSRPPESRTRWWAAFLVLIAMWIEGQSIHLAANAIGHQLDPATGGDAYRLTYMLDEHLSHILWHVAMLGLSALLIVAALRGEDQAPESSAGVGLISGAMVGFTHFAVTVEGQTAPLGIAGAAILLFATSRRGRLGYRQRPLLFFFAAAYTTALALYLVWAAMNGGRLPEFSAVGWLD